MSPNPQVSPMGSSDVTERSHHKGVRESKEQSRLRDGCCVMMFKPSGAAQLDHDW